MSLGDVMAQARLELFAEIGLIIFLAVFVTIVIHVFVGRGQHQDELLRMLPLADDTAESRTADATMSPLPTAADKEQIDEHDRAR
ncbi:MAG: hypothetical protein HYV63_15695 [Candidatus Schekmanbacteria bacterium]|nr:hypothetical protein [Candidatus Schekmanbacteria bacterium]